ncbi:hypothetical protein B566_EDAN001709 [Ephemera danica]|nr:hypothetical protein B566_EDAN001709 [Ephemera danica]
MVFCSDMTQYKEVAVLPDLINLTTQESMPCSDVRVLSTTAAAATTAITISHDPDSAVTPVTDEQIRDFFRESTYHYEEVGLIGSGSCGTVWKAHDPHRNGKFVAIKQIRVPQSEDGVPMSTLREIGLLKQIDQHEHPNIVR